MKRVRWNGKEYLFVDGAIATQEQYSSGALSEAHLFEDGLIRRFNRVVGTKEDLEWIEECEAPPLEDGAWERIVDCFSRALLLYGSHGTTRDLEGGQDEGDRRTAERDRE